MDCAGGRDVREAAREHRGLRLDLPVRHDGLHVQGEDGPGRLREAGHADGHPGHQEGRVQRRLLQTGHNHQGNESEYFAT